MSDNESIELNKENAEVESEELNAVNPISLINIPDSDGVVESQMKVDDELAINNNKHEQLDETSANTELFTTSEGETSEVQVIKIDEELPSEATPQLDSNRCHTFNNVPLRLAKVFFHQTLNCNNFTKGCKWSPDGLCILTNSDDNTLRLFNSPLNSYSLEDYNSDTAVMNPVLTMKESGTIYDFCWYPLMNSADPASCCFVSTSRLNPIHMWDAYTGKLRCTYKPYNNVDQVVSAISIAISGDGAKLYSGFDKMVRIFDVAIPGRECSELNLKKTNMGIVSCIACCPTDSNLFAIGSYSRAVGLYDDTSGENVFTLEGQSGGITHLMFSSDGEKLYTGGRMDPEILCWDLREPGKVLYVLKREVTTNQRMYFDIDKSGKFLMSGNTNGSVIIWDTESSVKMSRIGQKRLAPEMTFTAHSDCVNGVSFNPVYPIIATSSGQRKFPKINDNFGDDDDNIFTEDNIVFDNSLVLWWSGVM